MKRWGKLDLGLAIAITIATVYLTLPSGVPDSFSYRGWRVVMSIAGPYMTEYRVLDRFDVVRLQGLAANSEAVMIAKQRIDADLGDQ